MKLFSFLLAGFLLIVIGFGVGWVVKENQINIPVVQKIVDRSLDKYSIENLRKFNEENDIEAKLLIDKIIKENNSFTSSEFFLEFNPNLDGKTMKKTSGLINVPKISGQYPVVLMLRGYVDPVEYFIGEGTNHAAEVFANNGYITIAPDFLGYGDSDHEAENVFETRFQTYVTAINLIKSLDSLPSWDHKNIMIWAHSNGGQVALITLQALGESYPTTLWAPVTAPFPFSILYYTDEAEDKGKALRKSISSFEETYNSNLYSLDNHWGFINISTPIQLHQGTNDDAVPVDWSNRFTENMKTLGVAVEYHIHPGADHNMNPAWNEAMAENLAFFRKNSKK